MKLACCTEILAQCGVRYIELPAAGISQMSSEEMKRGIVRLKNAGVACQSVNLLMHADLRYISWVRLPWQRCCCAAGSKRNRERPADEPESVRQPVFPGIRPKRTERNLLSKTEKISGNSKNGCVLE